MTYPDQSRSTIPAPNTTAPMHGLRNLNPTCITFRRASVHVIVFCSDLRNHLWCFPPPSTCIHTGRVIGLVFPQCRLTSLSSGAHCEGVEVFYWRLAPNIISLPLLPSFFSQPSFCANFQYSKKTWLAKAVWQPVTATGRHQISN